MSHAPAQSPPRAVVWDLGNVLIRWDPRNLYRKMFAAAGGEAAMERFLTEVCTPEWNEQRDGGARFADGIAELSERFPDHAAYIAAYFSRWPEMLGGVIASNLAVLRAQQARGIPTYALTNWSAETFPMAQRLYPFLSDFRGIVMSGQEGMIKPDARFYQVLLDRFQLQPQATAFIDDSAKNIAAAAALGFVTVHYTPAMDVAAAFKNLGL